MTHHLMFSHRGLESDFRQFVKSPTEVGGYFIVSLDKPEEVDARILKREYGLPQYPSLAYISSWLVIPNDHPEPERKYQPGVQADSLWRLARETARSMRHAWAIHFHTHPSGKVLYSEDDLGFWKTYAVWAQSIKDTFSEACIISPEFAWGVYGVRFGERASDIEVERSQFISWYSERSKRALRAPEMPLRPLGAIPSTES